MDRTRARVAGWICRFLRGVALCLAKPSVELSVDLQAHHTHIMSEFEFELTLCQLVCITTPAPHPSAFPHPSDFGEVSLLHSLTPPLPSDFGDASWLA